MTQIKPSARVSAEAVRRLWPDRLTPGRWLEVSPRLREIVLQILAGGCEVWIDPEGVYCFFCGKGYRPERGERPGLIEHKPDCLFHEMASLMRDIDGP
jgi:hypothetical protein